MNGVELIAAERQRQIEAEGWTPEYDDEHNGHELAFAAACYVAFAATGEPARDYLRTNGMAAWPWSPTWWKPGAGNTSADRIRELVKAGALIAAEIDRLQRQAANAAVSGGLPSAQPRS